MKKIILIEDNKQMQVYIQEYLNEQDYIVEILKDYNDVVGEINIFNPDLILLDINLPKYDGFFFLKQIRKKFDIPIIILSARSDESEQIRGIENGANDYITKPFSINILLAKINMMLKTSKVGNLLSYKGLNLDINTFNISYNDKSIEVTKNEMQILRLLIEEKGNYVSRDKLLELLWDNTNFIDDNTLTVNITRVRKKLSDFGLDSCLINKRGVGYAIKIN